MSLTVGQIRSTVAQSAERRHDTSFFCAGRMQMWPDFSCWILVPRAKQAVLLIHESVDAKAGRCYTVMGPVTPALHRQQHPVTCQLIPHVQGRLAWCDW